jgi:hypothetical protein
MTAKERLIGPPVFVLVSLAWSDVVLSEVDPDAGFMEKRRAYIREVVLLDRGKWGIVVEFVLEEKELIGKEVLVDYDEIDDLDETPDGCLLIKTLEVPKVKRGDTVEITIRDRDRK